MRASRKPGYRDNYRMPQFAGGTYLNDAQGNTLEVLIAGRGLDHSFRASPLTLSSAVASPGRNRRSAPPAPDRRSPVARVSPASPEQLEELFGTTEVPLRVQIYAQRPELAVKFLEFGTTLRENRLLPGRLIGLKSGSASPSGTSAGAAWRCAMRKASTTGSPRRSSARLRAPERGARPERRRARRDRVRRHDGDGSPGCHGRLIRRAA